MSLRAEANSSRLQNIVPVSPHSANWRDPLTTSIPNRSLTHVSHIATVLLFALFASMSTCGPAFGDDEPPKVRRTSTEKRRAVKQAANRESDEPAIQQTSSNSDDQSPIEIDPSIPPEPPTDLPPVPKPKGEQTLEERINELETKLDQMRIKDDLLTRQLSSIGKKDDKPDPTVIKPTWKHQLNFESADKNFTVHIGGRTQVDTIFLDATPQAIGT